jgi:hypothetical protein
LKLLKVMSELFSHPFCYTIMIFFKIKQILFLLSLMMVIIILKQIFQLFMISSSSNNNLL